MANRELGEQSMKSPGLAPGYCALMDGHCTQILSSAPENEAFLAYSSQHPHPIPHDMQATARKANERGRKLETWEGLSPEARIIFCDLCKAIMDAESLWAEITYANQNVFFEMGYALAKERRLRLLRVPSKMGEQVELISTLKYIDYENVDELLGKAAVPFDGWSQAQQCDERAKMYRGGPHVLFLQTEYRTEATQQIYKQLEHELKPLGIRVRVDDPSELPGHDLLELTTLASRANFVVANLESKDRRDSHLHNAAAAFVAGYAMGKERRLLVLQEQPADRMLDLKQVTKEYNTATEAVQYLQRWLSDIMPELRSMAQDSHSRRQRAKDQIQRWQVDLGHVAAEYDPLLPECFVDNQAYAGALAGNRTLFVGRKGAGKTANCLVLKTQLQERANTAVAFIAPEKLQLREMTETVTKSLDRVPDAAVFEAMWRFVLVAEIGATLAKHYEQNPHLDDEGVYETIADLFKRIGCALGQSFDQRLSQAMLKLPKLPEAGGNARQVLLQQFHTQDIAQLLEVLRSLRHLPQVFVLIDNLDRDWTTAPAGITVGLVNGLLNEAQKLSHKDLSDLVRIVVFLRSDIYQVAASKDPDSDKKTPIHLTWDAEGLFELVTERMKASIRDAGQAVATRANDVWCSLFAETMPEGQLTFDYLVARTMLRPRDILQFCSGCLDKARQSGHDRVLAKDIQTAERQFSRDLFDRLKMEYAVGYPDLETIGAELIGAPSTMLDREFKARLQKATVHPEIERYSIDELYTFCYDSGIVGLQVSDSVYYSFADGLSREAIPHAVRLAEANGVPLRVVIHKGLHDKFEIRQRNTE